MTQINEKISIGEKVRKLRTDLQMTIYDVGDSAGLTGGYIANLERGVVKTITNENLSKIAKALGIKTSELLDGTRYKVDRVRLL